MKDAINNPMLAEVIPPKVLPRSLTRFDLVTIYFALIFGSYGAAQMASMGWAAIPMLTLAAITFLVPCALASYELGTLFPGEGGIYIWAHKTLGPSHGFIAGWLSWIPIFLLLPLGATTITAHLQVAFSAKWPLWAQVACQLAIVNGVALISMARLRISQGYVRAIFFLSFATALTVFVVGLLHAKPATSVTNEIASFDFTKYGTLYSAAILWLLGVEVPFNMGAEFKEHKKTAGVMMLWGSVALLVGYYLGIVGTLFSLPQASIDGTTGVALAAGSLWPLLGSFVAIAICVAVTSQDVAYMNAYSRLLFISGIERRLPAVMGQVTEKSRVPIPALLVQALGANLVILVFSTQTKLAVAFNIYLAALVAVWCASLYYLYFGLLVARKKFKTEYEHRKDRIWSIPGGQVGDVAAALWGIVFKTVAIY